MGYLPSTMGHLPGTMGHLPITMGHLPGTNGHLPGTMGHLPGTIGHLPGTGHMTQDTKSRNRMEAVVDVFCAVDSSCGVGGSECGGCPIQLGIKSLSHLGKLGNDLLLLHLLLFFFIVSPFFFFF